MEGVDLLKEEIEEKEKFYDDGAEHYFVVLGASVSSSIITTS